MNYRHHYHAGNFADVVKHFVLTLILQKLRAKETPFCVLDTHSGIGLYDLQAEASQKTKEYETGIGKLLAAELPQTLFSPYLEAVKAVNGGGEEMLHYYPGSPLISRHFLRPQDRLILCELHPEDFKTLLRLCKNDERIRTLEQDAYIALKAHLPPKERRGLILIDPPFENKDEFKSLLKGIKEGYRRFSQGIFLIWYPLKERRAVQGFYGQLAALDITKLLKVEFHLQTPQKIEGLTGCGLIIINPPWMLKDNLRLAIPLLHSYMGIEGFYSQAL